MSGMQELARRIADGGRASEASRESLRQQILVLYLATSSLASHVVAWTRYDGSSADFPVPGSETEPPYPSALDAMRAGWSVIAMPDVARSESQFRYRCVLERKVRARAAHG